MNDSTLSKKNGEPKDSMVFYFPKKMFNDTTRYIFYKDTVYKIESDYPRDWFIIHFLKDTTLLKQKDSLVIKEDLFFGQLWSFALFKMNERLLSNYFLNKEIYRLIVDRSFHAFSIVTIERNADDIIIRTEQLNRQVTYPYIVYANVRFDSSDREEITNGNEAKYNNTNYYVSNLIQKSLTWKEWNGFIELLNKVYFWESPPRTYSNINFGLDGSLWLLEAQNKYGYQYFCTRQAFDENYGNHDVDSLFRYVIKLSGLEYKKFKFY